MRGDIVPQQEKSVALGFGTLGGFEAIQRAAKLLAASDLVPPQFKGNVANCVIALEMAARMNASPMAVVQNLYIVYGKPSWSASFIIACINSTGRFSPLRFEMTGEGEKRSCVAWATELSTGERLESPPVSYAMAKSEGWVGKNGSKWVTMPELMLRYRTATLFGRLYAPEVLMGMATQDEVIDITPDQSEIKAAAVSADIAEPGMVPAPEPPKPGKKAKPEPAEDFIEDVTCVGIKCPRKDGETINETNCGPCPDKKTCPERKDMGL